MAENRYGIRLEATGGAQVVASFREIGRAAESSFGTVGAAAGRLMQAVQGPTAAVAAIVAATGAVLTAGINEIKQTQETLGRLNTSLQVTGNTSGLTSQALQGFAETMQQTTRASAEQVREAIAVLNTYGLVGGNAFLQVIRSAQDMSVLFGGDVKSNTEKIAEAMFKLQRGEAEGLAKQFKFIGAEALASVESLAKMGRGSEALERFLKALQDRLGGTGTGDRSGIAGAQDAFSKSIRQMTEDLANFLGLGPQVEKFFNILAYGAGKISALVKPETMDAEITKALDQMRKIQADINRLVSRGYSEDSIALVELRRRFAEQKTRYESLIDQLGADQQKQDRDNRAAADEGTQRRNADRLAELRRGIDSRMEALKGEQDIAEQVAKAILKARNEIIELQALREQAGADVAAIDSAIANRRELLRRELAGINKPVDTILEEYRRKAAGQTVDPREAAAQEAIDKVSRAGGNLGQKIEAGGLARQAYDNSPEALRAYTAELNAYVDGQQAALEVQGQSILLSQEIQQDMGERIARVREEIATDAEKRAELQRQVEVLRQYGLTADEAERYLRKMDPTAIKMKEAVQDLGLSFSSAFEDAIVKGEKLGDVVRGLGQDILRIIARRVITEPLAGSISTGLTSFFGFADGGVMTAQGPLPLRRYARGGVASSPQLALYGEGSRPEAFVPLPDGRRIPAVVDLRGGESGGIHVEVIDQRGAGAPPVEVQPLGPQAVRLLVRREIADAVPGIVDASVSEVADRQRRGAMPAMA